MHDEIMNLVYNSIYQDSAKLKMIKTLEQKVLKKNISPQAAASKLLKAL